MIIFVEMRVIPHSCTVFMGPHSWPHYAYLSIMFSHKPGVQRIYKFSSFILTSFWNLFRVWTSENIESGGVSLLKWKVAIVGNPLWCFPKSDVTRRDSLGIPKISWGRAKFHTFTKTHTKHNFQVSMNDFKDCKYLPRYPSYCFTSCHPQNTKGKIKRLDLSTSPCHAHSHRTGVQYLEGGHWSRLFPKKRNFFEHHILSVCLSKPQGCCWLLGLSKLPLIGYYLVFMVGYRGFVGYIGLLLATKNMSDN